MRRAPIAALLILAALLLQACSAVRVGYGNANSLARWWLDQYLDFSPEQNQLVEDRLTRLHAWHRRSELPGYAAFLVEARVLIDRPTTTADALRLGDDIVLRIRRLADKALPDLADLFLNLIPAQIDQLAARFAERNKAYVKDAAVDDSEAARHEARAKRLLSRAEYWFGNLSEVQEKEFRRLIAAQPSGANFWYEERLRRQRELVDIARRIQRERPGREAALALLRDYANRFDTPPDAARRATADALRRNTAELAIALHAMTTPAQRNHARDRIDDLVRDITELSGEG